MHPAICTQTGDRQGDRRRAGLGIPAQLNWPRATQYSYLHHKADSSPPYCTYLACTVCTFSAVASSPLCIYKLTGASPALSNSSHSHIQWHQCLQNYLRRTLPPAPPEKLHPSPCRSSKYESLLLCSSAPIIPLPCAIANSSAMQATSRPASLELSSQRSSSDPTSQLPEAVHPFFVSVPTAGFPAPKKQKEQPWRKLWKPQPPTEDGKLLVACPKICTYGMSLLLKLRSTSTKHHEIRS